MAGLRKMQELPKYLLHATIHFHKYLCLHVLEEENEVGGPKQDTSGQGQRTPGSPVGVTHSLGEEGNLPPRVNFQGQRPSRRRVGMVTNYNHKKILASQESL